MTMKIKILGAHNIESKDTGCACLLIDDVLALDAGALTSRLSFEAQQKLRAVLLTHWHYDHVKDIPILGMNCFLLGKTLEIYTTRPDYEDLAAYLLDGKLYPDFREKPPDKPALRFNIVEPGREESVEGYRILPVTVNHAIPCVGYQVTSPDGKKLFYTSDTGPGLAECWRQVSPDLLIIEVTSINKYQDFSIEVGHLTPALLQKELESFRELKGYLPRVVTIHANPIDEKELEAELSVVAGTLKIDIQLGREGMNIIL
jgi:ribonuclease BN (tRNA processing enzyme)